MTDIGTPTDELLAEARALLGRIDSVDEVLAGEMARLEAAQQPWLAVLRAAGLESPEAVQAYLSNLSADERRDAELAGATPIATQEG